MYDGFDLGSKCSSKIILVDLFILSSKSSCKTNETLNLVNLHCNSAQTNTI